MDPQAQSVSPTKQDTPAAEAAPLSFYDALRACAEHGKHITKKEWGNPAVYGVLDGTVLKLMKEDGKLYNWIIGDGDLSGEDWIIL